MAEVISARTLRRHTVRLENRNAELHMDLQQLLLKLVDLDNHLHDRLNETNERLRVIEGDVERMQKVIGVLAKHSKANVPIVDPETFRATAGMVLTTAPLAQVHPLRRV